MSLGGGEIDKDAGGDVKSNEIFIANALDAAAAAAAAVGERAQQHLRKEQRQRR